MSLLSNKIDVEVQHPELWRLSLRIDSGSVRFVAHSDIEQNSLMSRSVELEDGEDDFLRSLENCIYDNPFFLLDFKRVDVAYTSRRFMGVPERLDEAGARAAFEAMYGKADGDVAVDALPHCQARIAFEMPSGLLPFINRTFNNPPIRHHLSAVCEHFAKKCRNTGIGKEFVYFHDGYADVMVYLRGRFAFANTFECATAEDAMFFVLNVWNDYSLDVHNDELQIAGDKLMREAVAPMLREYVTYVMPAIFPAAAMRIGMDAMKAPFDLILMSLCE